MAHDLVVSLVLYQPLLDELRQTFDSLKASKLKLKVCIFDNSPSPLDRSCLYQLTNYDYYFNEGKNFGFGKAHNINFKKFASEAKYFLILNPDVYFEGDILEQLRNLLERDVSIGLASPLIHYPSGEIQRVQRRVPRPVDYAISFLKNKGWLSNIHSPVHDRYLLQDMDLEKPIICPVVSGCFMFFRSSVFSEMSGFDERFFLYAEDTDLSRRVAMEHKTVVFPYLQAKHYHRRGAYQNRKLFLLFVKNLGIYFNKWGWIYDSGRKSLNERVDYYQPPY